MLILAVASLVVSIFLFFQIKKKDRYILEQEQRLKDSMNQFAYVTSHDLQEPLRAITSYSQLLKKRCADSLSADGKDYLSYILKAVQRMTDLYNELYDYKDIDDIAIDKEDLNLFELLQSMLVDEFKSLIEIYEIPMPIVTYDDLPIINADEKYIKRLFFELFDNAMKFAGKHGLYVHISTKKYSDRIVVSVEDNGIGMSAEHTSKIFILFQQLDKDVKGSGMGLAMCKKIIDKHGGDIWVKASEGHGSKISFSLPLLTKEEAR